VPLERSREKIINYSRNLLAGKQTELLNAARYFKAVTGGLLQTAHQNINQGKYRINHATRTFLSSQKNDVLNSKIKLDISAKQFLKQTHFHLESNRRQISLLDPKMVLKRGYSITLLNGKVIQDADSINEGDQIETRLYSGTMHSTVNSINFETQNEQESGI
jgi:exonuclease VII large subunit